MLFGNKNLIRAARLNGQPNSDSIGRGMKVNKEELLGMLVALELYFKRDHNADWREWENRVNVIRQSVSSIDGVRSEMFVPGDSLPRAARPHHLGSECKTFDRGQRTTRLREGDPSIEVRPNTKEGLELGVWMLEPKEVEVVARRVREVLKGALSDIM